MNIALRNLNFKYKNAEDLTLSDVSFTLPAGKLMAIVGESGSGKSTTLRLIAGLETPISGQIEMDQKLLTDGAKNLPPEKRNVGMLFQDYALFPHLTVEKNIAFGLDGVSKSERKQRVCDMLDLVELGGYEKRYPHELSGGQQQRVALARALAPKPKVLLMDEPFSNLDAHLHGQIRSDVEQIVRKAEITTIFVTHDKEDALEIADHVIVMEQGKILRYGDPSEVLR